MVEAGLNSFCRRNGLPDISDLALLTGGSNMEMWAFRSGEEQLILRRFRRGQAPVGDELNLPIEAEANVIRWVHIAGVKAPEVVEMLIQSDDLGPGYVMKRLDGESLPTKIYRNARFVTAVSKLSSELAVELAKIHALKPNDQVLDQKSPTILFQELEEIIEGLGLESAVFSIALHWLRNNLPADLDLDSLIHGDFRVGNFLVTEDGLSAILDWELAHTGAREEDLAWLCMPSWRFGNYEKEAGGFATYEVFFDAYEAASGHRIDRAAFDWYLIYSCLKWGISTALMASWWRSGRDANIERLLIGTRVSEVELDLLLLLESLHDIHHQPSAASLEIGSVINEHDVSAAELVCAARTFLEETVIANAQGAEKFHARLAQNALSIAERILHSERPPMRKQVEHPLEYTGSNPVLCKGLLDGTIDWREPKLLDYLRRSSLQRCSLHQPKYSAIQVALSKWRIE